MNETKQRKIISREQEIAFTNFTDEDFEGQWNKRIYRLKAGKSYYLPFYQAESFGKNLVDRELNKLAQKEIKEIRAIDPRIDQKEVERREMSILNNAKLRQEMMEKCVEILEPEDFNYASPKEIPVRQIPLKTQERSARMVEQGLVAKEDLGFNKPVEMKLDVE